MLKILSEDEIRDIAIQYPDISKQIANGNLKGINVIIGKTLKDVTINEQEFIKGLYKHYNIPQPVKVKKQVIKTPQRVKVIPTNTFYKDKSGSLCMKTLYVINNISYDIWNIPENELTDDIKCVREILINQLLR